MSLPSVARDKITNKVSLVTRPSVTLVQPATGTSASQSQPKLIYSTSYNVVQQPIQSQSQSSQQQQAQSQPQYQQQIPTYFSTTSVNKPKPLSQQISIISSKTIRPPTVNKIIQLPSTTISPAATNRVQPPIAQTPPPQQVATTSTASTSASASLHPNRVQTIQTIHFKSNVPSAPIHHKTTTVNSRPIITDRSPAIVPVTADTRLELPSQSSTSSTIIAGSTTIKRHDTTIQKLHPHSNASSNHKANATTVNVVKVDPVKNRYRTILENLLQLKNNFIKRTITQAIQQKLCNQSNEDLLNVIFKSFELTLLSVNVEQISLNETYLNATLAFLAKVIETGRFMELIENRKETKHIGRFVTSEMSTILNKVALESVYARAREIFKQQQRGSYAQILELLNKAISCTNETTDTKMADADIEFWLNGVLPLVFDADDDIQTNAIEAINKAIPLLISSRHQSHSMWPQIRNNILSDYTKKIVNCFKSGSPKWHTAWCLCVRLLDFDIPRSASTLNAFLSIVEPALRSNVPLRRAEGYLCWKVLLEVLVRHNRLNSEKRLKLMCTPLKSLQARTVEIATNKFKAWWYVICNVQENVENYISMVFEPFLQFCFGQVFAEPNLQLHPSENATQVKSFPNVSLMAICTFIRMLECMDKQLEELFTKFMLKQPNHLVVSESIFRINSTSALIINACGEATIMLNNLTRDSNITTDCTTLAVVLWTQLFKHINQAKQTTHINLILNNVLQMMKIVTANPNQTKMIPVVCLSIIDHVGNSFIFQSDENSDSNVALDGDVSALIAKYMHASSTLPSIPSNFECSLSKLLAHHQNADDFIRNFTNFLTVIDEQMFRNTEHANNSTEYFQNKFQICCEFVNAILTHIQLNANAFKPLRPNSKTTTRIPNVFYRIVFWPLSLQLSKNEFDVYTKTLLKTIDLLLTMMNKAEFCKECGKIVKTIIESPVHCVYINDAIATLFEYMVYDFTDLKEAPIDMLNLCTAAIKSESKATFQDLNAIAEALIKYRRAITQKQFDLIAPKMRDVLKLIENEKANMRTDSALIRDLKELVGDTAARLPPPSSKADKTTPTQSNKSPRAANKIEKDDFVVVNKVWKLEPNKLTEHQREKMKTRRCDIPAMYNDLSQSQDSMSIQEWTPTALANKSQAQSKSNNSSEKTPPPATRSNAESTESPASQSRNKKNAKVSPKRPAPNQSQQSQSNESGQNENKSDNESEPQNSEDDANNSKRRLTRELNRIHINAKHDEVPYNNLPESNRLTRSLAKKTVDEKPLDTSSQERRKTRSDNAKATPDPKDLKRKVTRASMANSPMQSKQKNKPNANRSLSNANDKETAGGSGSGEPTPKRRLTRQSRAEESDADDTFDDKKVEIKKVELKRTEFVDTLELKVEKLEGGITNKIEPKENANEADALDKEYHAMAEQEAKVEIPMEAEKAMEPENELVEKSVAKEDDDIKMDVDEAVDAEIVSTSAQQLGNVEKCPNTNDEIEKKPEMAPMELELEPAAQAEGELEPESTSKDGNNEQNSQILVETATVPNGVVPEIEDHPPTSEQPDQPAQQDEQLEKANENANEIPNRSYMETLVFDGESPSKSMMGSTIITSPGIDAPRSIEFLNDTLNISPIAAGERENEERLDTVPTNGDKIKDKKSTATNLSGIERLDDSVVIDKQKPPDDDDDDKKELLVTVTTNENENAAATAVTTAATTATVAEKEQIVPKTEQIVEVGNGKNLLATAPAVPESPVVSTSRQLKISLPMQSSTPTNIKSHQSPVSSKFKPQFTGRGAQLLKMINSNRSSPKPASPTPAAMDEHTFKTASPTINQLETAPICENVMNTPEPKSATVAAAKDKHAHEKQPKPNENGNFLTLSGALPSPYESPGISILKRKSSHFSLDDSMHSPAPKRQKRVSFGFPLSQTKEYIIDDDFTPFYMLPSGDSPSRRTSRMKKLKFKRNKYHSDSSSKVLHDNNKSTSAHGRGHVSVKKMQEYLGMDMESYKAKQQEEKKLAAKAAAVAAADDEEEEDEDDEEEESESDDENGAISNATEHDSNSDDSSTESNDDDPENEAPAVTKSGASSQPSPSLKAFSDDAIMAHLMSKYSPNELLQKFDTVFDSKVLTKRLSTIMASDKHIESAVLEDFAEKHSESFLEHAITENLCSVICDQLTLKSANGINDYIADKINADDQFASDFLDRVSVNVLRQKLMDIVTSSKREQQILLCDFLAALKDAMYRVSSPRVADTSILPEHIHLWVAKLFDQFKLTPEQYLQLTSIYIQKNPPATLDHLE